VWIVLRFFLITDQPYDHMQAEHSSSCGTSCAQREQFSTNKHRHKQHPPRPVNHQHHRHSYSHLVRTGVNNDTAQRLTPRREKDINSRCSARGKQRSGAHSAATQLDRPLKLLYVLLEHRICRKVILNRLICMDNGAVVPTAEVQADRLQRRIRQCL